MIPSIQKPLLQKKKKKKKKTNGGNVNQNSHYGEQNRDSSKKLKVELLSTPGHVSKGNKISIPKTYLHAHV
jgi:hypothetical protein